MTRKLLVGAFLFLFGIAMTNLTFANHENIACTMQYDPVCSTDGKTYGNACTAGVAHAEIAYEGECKIPAKACTKEYKPVCGYVEVQCVRAPCYPIATTFGNKCMAEAEGATNISEGACGDNERYNKLANTSWELTTFNGEPVEGTSTLSFESEKFSAKICNSKAGSYTVDGKTIATPGDMISTLMFCMGPVGTYESHFDLSGAKYELATDGGNHLMITTVDGYEYQWKSTRPNVSKPVARPEWKRYGRIIWQLNQLAQLNGYDTVAQKQAMAQDIIEKIDYILMVSSMTRLGNAKIMHVKASVQFYHDHVGEGLFDTF